MQALLENPITLVILIGIISTIYSRFKGSTQENHKGKPFWPGAPVQDRQKDRHKQAIPMQDRRQEIPKPGTAEPFEPARRVDRRRITNIEKKLVDAKKEAEKMLTDRQLANGQKPQRESGANANEEKTRPEETKHSGKTLSADGSRLVSGLIWSEVLGPPRAKKPFSNIRK